MKLTICDVLIISLKREYGNYFFSFVKKWKEMEELRSLFQIYKKRIKIQYHKY